MDLVYLDNNATTRTDPRAVEAMLPYFDPWYGNASSMHRFGQQSRHAIDQARSAVASLIGCATGEIVFTGGGTESINTAIRGMVKARAPRRKIITSSVEHSATRQVCQQLTREGVQVIETPVDRAGALDVDCLAASIDDETALVSIMWANNETGVLFPVEQIAQLCRERRVPFHTDGTQAVGKIPCDVRQLGCDLMSFAAHKFHGPKGVGGLYIRRGVRIPPLLLGGPQELERRGGTENVPGVVGMGKAAELAVETLPEMPRVATLRDRIEREILSRIPDSDVIGRTDQRLPNTTNIAFHRLEAEAILLLLSEQNVCASAGSACSSGSLEPSHVLRAMGIPEPIAHGAIRFSLSRFTTDAEIDRALEVLPAAISRLRTVLPVG